MEKEINIKMAEMAVAKDSARIKTNSIGSCVVTILYDEINKIGGMAHSMLPTRKKIDDEISEIEEKLDAKYVDEAIELLVREIERKGGNRKNLNARLIGGSRMFKILSGDKFGIGYKNIQSAKDKLEEMGISLVSEETGGTVGRMAEFNVQNGLIDVSTKM